MSDDKLLELQVEAWKKIVDVQQHFNDMGMRVRNFAITLLAALVTAAGVALREHLGTLAFFLAMAALVSWLAFALLDIFVYHRLLRGAVQQGKAAEDVLGSHIAFIGLTHAISAASPVWPARGGSATDDEGLPGARQAEGKCGTGCKLKIFYLAIGVFLGGLTFWTYRQLDEVVAPPQEVVRLEILTSPGLEAILEHFRSSGEATNGTDDGTGDGTATGAASEPTGSTGGSR